MDGASIDPGAARTAAELRLQLAEMVAAAHMLERSVEDEKGRRYLAMMEQGVCRMLRIVGRLELSARLGKEDGEVRMERSPVDLGRLTRELGERLGELLKWAGVELTVAAPEHLGAAVDEGLIRQMLMELVSNAAKAGGHVTLTLVRREDRAVFTVEDDGPGVDPQRLGQLFSSGPAAAPDWRRGGVGVAIARRAAYLHGGAMMADCAMGQGLRATASIPLGGLTTAVLETPAPVWDRGGFNDELIGLSDLLPVEAFWPKMNK